MNTVPEKDGELAIKLLKLMDRMTHDRYAQIAYDNAVNNNQYLKHGDSLSALRGVELGESDSAVVIAAGPSIKPSSQRNRRFPTAFATGSFPTSRCPSIPAHRAPCAGSATRI
jgi:hypothetical protein